MKQISKKDIEIVCLVWLKNQLNRYEQATENFYKLIEKPLHIEQDLLLDYVYNSLTRFNENILKNDNLKNDSLQFPFSKLHKIIDYYFENQEDFFKELYYQEDDTHLTDVLDVLFYEHIERILNYNNNFTNLNDNIQRYILNEFNIFAYLEKEDAINLLKLLV